MWMSRLQIQIQSKGPAVCGCPTCEPARSILRQLSALPAGQKMTNDELFSDQIYISKFITFTKYFIAEFINCSIEESIFPLIPCEKKCCK